MHAVTRAFSVYGNAISGLNTVKVFGQHRSAADLTLKYDHAGCQALFLCCFHAPCMRVRIEGARRLPALTGWLLIKVAGLVQLQLKELTRFSGSPMISCVLNACARMPCSIKASGAQGADRTPQSAPAGTVRKVRNGFCKIYAAEHSVVERPAFETKTSDFELTATCQPYSVGNHRWC